MTRRAVARAHRDAARILGWVAEQLSAPMPSPQPQPARGLPAGTLTVRPEAPIQITFGSPRAITASTWRRITGGVLHPSAHSADGGFWWYEVSMPDLYGYAVAATKRKDCVTHLALASSIVLYSQLPLSEAAGVVLDMARLDPRPGMAGSAPRFAANELAGRGGEIIDVWQARQLRHEGRGVGDAQMLAVRLGTLKDLCGLWHVQQAKLDLDAARERLSATHLGRTTNG